MAENTFKDALARGETMHGLWLALADPYSAEICAGAGFDWLLIDGEHAPNDLRSTLASLQALAGYPVAPLVRPPVGDPVGIKQLLDIGARNFIIPMVETAAQALDLVAATRYPPHGVRGVGAALARASRFGRDAAYLNHADAGVCLILQIESVTGLDELDAIAAVDGVDGLFIGPADLAASFGRLGNPGHADVQNAIQSAVTRIRAAGKAAGILSTDEAQARTYLEWGYTFVAVGTDVTLLARATTALATRFKTD
ncbi:4-hydroxy-2-oxoheptanedioate aldolase [Deinococcus humi]|uniref:4-hydroxy-2-oxoheptanedioate aldolase n=1 Tax=Deinococcus humi TaxID=662880 RepID=A0A7W8JWM3_9DEIO|nr:4-hydroxy-2-oxoheptanedioate aldolase [Deinococcus humi]MBB5363024.1 4-hydroxy-2-oxoheptanedioate aldolase [Deinococcus humi]GGO25064.1 2,4-dihydroxyhept-2-ene-1,7-dioic acid aldolase [Deinococcus humi]